jgi:hypothetical protein
MNRHVRVFVPRKTQNRRGFDFGAPVDWPESRAVEERRKLHVDVISKPDWLAYRALLGTYQHAIDKSFMDIFGSK